MHIKTISILFFLISTSLFAQKARVDTTFYGRGGQEVTPGQEFLTYEVCDVDRRGRKDGICAKISKKGNILETIHFEKGVREGQYFRYSLLQKPLVQGSYIEGKRNGIWVTYNQKEEPVQMSTYEDDQILSQRKFDFQPADLSQTGDDSSKNSNKEIPKFEGGKEAWFEFLKNNLKYPVEAKRYGVQGFVYMKVFISKEGNLIHTLIEDSPGVSLSKEALRVMAESPKWIPGKINGQPVDAVLPLRLQFRLK